MHDTLEVADRVLDGDLRSPRVLARLIVQAALDDLPADPDARKRRLVALKERLDRPSLDLRAPPAPVREPAALQQIKRRRGCRGERLPQRLLLGRATVLAAMSPRRSVPLK